MTTTDIKDKSLSIPPQSTLLAIDSRRRSSGNGYRFTIPNPGFKRKLHRMRISTIRAWMHLPNVTVWNNTMTCTRTTGPNTPITFTINMAIGWYPASNVFVTALLALMNSADPTGLYTQVGGWDSTYNTFTIKAGDLWEWRVDGGDMTNHLQFFHITLGASSNTKVFYDAHLVWTQGVYVHCPEITRQMNQSNEEANGESAFLIYVRIYPGQRLTQIYDYFVDNCHPTWQLYSSMTIEQLTIELRDDFGNLIESLIPSDKEYEKIGDWFRLDLIVQTDPTD